MKVDPKKLEQSQQSLQPVLQEPLLGRTSSGIELTERTTATQVKVVPVVVTMRKSKTRFLALAMAALLMFGNNYAFDNPQALQKPIMNDVGVTSPQYNLLYSAFSFPNIFLTLAGGFMIDFLGVRFGVFVFTFAVLITQSIVALGGTLEVFWIMLAGRACFGIASENLIISQSAIVAQWFRGSELSTAIGIIMTIPEIASAMNSFFSPLIYEQTQQLAYPLWLSTFICAFSLFCACVLIILDRRAEKEEAELEIHEEGEAEVEEKVSFKDLKHFTATFWILLLICMLTLGVYIPFLDDANDFYQEKFKFTAVESGRLLMIPYLVSALSSSFVGMYVDKVGRRRFFILVTTGLFTFSCLLFGALPAGEEENPQWWSVVPLFTLGLSFAFYSCVVIPSVQYVVEERVMGTAFGLMGSLESVAFTAFPLIAASIVEASEDKDAGYSRVGFFFTGMSALGFLLGVSLYFFDKKGSIILDFINPEEPNAVEKEVLKRYRRDEEESDSDDDEEEEDNSKTSDNEEKEVKEDKELITQKE